MRLSFASKVAVGFGLGIGVGAVFGPAVAPLGAVGKWVIQLIKALATPLLFFSIVDSVVRTHIPLRAGVQMLFISLLNGLLALGIGLGISRFLEPGRALSAIVRNTSGGASSSALHSVVGRKVEWQAVVEGFIPTSVVEPFVQNSVLQVVVLALILGAGLRVALHELKQDARGIGVTLRLFERTLGWVVQCVPIAVFSVVAKTVGESGFQAIWALGPYLCAAFLGLGIQVFIIYSVWIRWVARLRLRDFWREARDAVFYALGASSSLATLPVTLRCLDRLRVAPWAARLSACVGTNFNNDGILLYEAMAVLFVAQAYGIDLTFGQQLVMALSCVAAGVGIAGIPEAGLISLSLVLVTVGLPTESLPLLLSVDWILSRARAATNVTADLTVALVLNRFEKSREQVA